LQDVLSWIAARFANEGKCWERAAASLTNPVPHPYGTAEQTWVCGAVNLAATAATMLAMTTVLVVAMVLWQLRWPKARPNDRLIGALAVLTFVWAVLPPIWFWFEHWFLYSPYGDKEAFAQFRHSQQLSAAIWAGILAASAVVLSRAQAREPNVATPASDGEPSCSVYGSFREDPVGSSDVSALVWTNTRHPSEAEIEALKRGPYPYLHVVARTDNHRTVVDTYKCGRMS
jgi:hypothetical protein